MRRLIAALAGLTALGVAAGFGGGWWPVLDLAAAFRPQLGALAGTLALIAGLTRQRWMAGLAAGAALVAVLGLGPALKAPALGGVGRPLTLLYANVQEANPVPEALAERLLATEADVLVTSETSRGLAERLTAAYPYRLMTQTRGNAKRTAIWSRHPLGQARLHLNNTTTPTAASAAIELGEGLELGLIGVHFSRPTERIQPRQITGLGEIAATLPRPLVVIGDFNAAPWTATLARAAQASGTRLVGGWRVTWWGAYPTPLGPLPAPWGHQIDHLLISDGVALAAIETLALPGSDHAGLLARLRLSPP